LGFVAVDDCGRQLRLRRQVNQSALAVGQQAVPERVEELQYEPFACRQFIEKNAALVATVEMERDHVVVDVDRAQDYEAWSRSP